MDAVAALRHATAHGLPTHAAAAIARVDALTDEQRAACRDDACAALHDALRTFAASPDVVRRLLVALRRVWPPRTPPALLAVVLAAARRHRDERVARAAVGLLCEHMRGANPRLMAPQVLDAAAHADRAHGASVGWWVALVVIALGSESPADLAKEHGEHGLVRIAARCVELAVVAQARGGPMPVLNGRGWPCIVLAMYPRLRERRA